MMFNLERFLPYHLNRTGMRLAEAFTNDLAGFDVTLPMWRVLAVLWHHGTMRAADISLETTIEQSTLSRLLRAMEGRGLLTRERSSIDARSITVMLTPGGTKLTKALIPLALRNEKVSLRGLSDEEVGTLFGLLQKIFDNAGDLLP